MPCQCCQGHDCQRIFSQRTHASVTHVINSSKIQHCMAVWLMLKFENPAYEMRCCVSSDSVSDLTTGLLDVRCTSQKLFAVRTAIVVCLRVSKINQNNLNKHDISPLIYCVSIVLNYESANQRFVRSQTNLTTAIQLVCNRYCSPILQLSFD
jgi:hypothetical protein